MDELNPYAAPQAELEEIPVEIDGDTDVVREVNTLLMPEGTQLPRRCVSCNQPAVHGFNVWSSRLTGAALVMRVALVVIVILGVSFLRHAVPKAYEAFVLPMIVLVLIPTSYVTRRSGFVSFRFFLCGKHRVLRILTQTLLWSGVALVICREMARDHFPTAADDPFPGFLLLFFASLAVAHLFRVNVRPLMGRKNPYGFRGFGRAYLDSFSTIDESTSTQTPVQ